MKTKSIFLLCSFFIKIAVLVAVPMWGEAKPEGQGNELKHSSVDTQKQTAISRRKDLVPQGLARSLGMATAVDNKVVEEKQQQGSLETDSSGREDQQFIVAEGSSSDPQLGMKDVSSKDLEEIDAATKNALIDGERLIVSMRAMPKDTSVRTMALAANAKANCLDEIAVVLSNYDDGKQTSLRSNQGGDAEIKLAADEVRKVADEVRQAIVNVGFDLGSFDNSGANVDPGILAPIGPRISKVSLGEKEENHRAVTIAIIHTAIGRPQFEITSPYLKLDELWEKSQQAWDCRTTAYREKEAAEQAYRTVLAQLTKEQATYDAAKPEKTLLGKIAHCATVASAIGGCFNIPFINIEGICNGAAVICNEANQFGVGHRLRRAKKEEEKASKRKEMAAVVFEKFKNLAPELEDKASNAEEQERDTEIEKSKTHAALIKLPPEPCNLNQRFWRNYISPLLVASKIETHLALAISSDLMTDHSWLDDEVKAAWKKREEISAKYARDLQDPTSVKQKELNDLKNKHAKQRVIVNTARDIVLKAREQLNQIQGEKQAAKKELEAANDHLDQLEKKQDVIMMNASDVAASQDDDGNIFQKQTEARKRIKIAKHPLGLLQSSFDAAQEDLQLHEVELIKEEEEEIKCANKYSKFKKEIEREVERAGVRADADLLVWRHYWGDGLATLREEVVQQPYELRKVGFPVASFSSKFGCLRSGAADIIESHQPLSLTRRSVGTRKEASYEIVSSALYRDDRSRGDLLSESMRLPLVTAEGRGIAAMSRLANSPQVVLRDENLQNGNYTRLNVASYNFSDEEEKKDDEEKFLEGGGFLHAASGSLIPPSFSGNMPRSLNRETTSPEIMLLQQPLGVDKSAEEVREMCAAPARATELARAAKNKSLEAASPEEVLSCWDAAIWHAAEAQQGYEKIMIACEIALAQAPENKDLLNYARETKNQSADWKIQALYYKMEKAVDEVDVAQDQLAASLETNDGIDLLEKIYAVGVAYNELAETCKNTLQQNLTASHRFRYSWIRKLREAEKEQAVWKVKVTTCEKQNKAAIEASEKAKK